MLTVSGHKCSRSDQQDNCDESRKGSQPSRRRRRHWKRIHFLLTNENDSTLTKYEKGGVQGKRTKNKWMLSQRERQHIIFFFQENVCRGLFIIFKTSVGSKKQMMRNLYIYPVFLQHLLYIMFWNSFFKPNQKVWSRLSLIGVTHNDTTRLVANVRWASFLHHLYPLFFCTLACTCPFHDMPHEALRISLYNTCHTAVVGISKLSCE